MATSIPPSDTKLDDEDTEAKIECDNCHDHFLTEFMVNMDGIADGQTWCKHCHAEFLSLCGRLDR
jgi:hypothetical protein